jgi:protein-L-isoaspartate(D-aspartate) O-methyltransferase
VSVSLLGLTSRDLGGISGLSALFVGLTPLSIFPRSRLRAQLLLMSNVAAQNDSSEWIERVSDWVLEAGILNEDVETHVKNAFARVPREPFLEAEQRRFALGDIDLPIGQGQVLYRPSLLIRIAGLINLQKRMRILVLGSGSGYLCAVLNAAGGQVFGVENVGALAQGSRKLLDGLGHHGVVIQRGDANKGWDEAAPFDAIIVTYPLSNDLDLPLSQLRVGGSLVALVTSERAARITLWRRTEEAYKRTVFEEVPLSQ